MADFVSPAFYDLFGDDARLAGVRRKLRPLLTGVRESILEVGAGTGLLTTSLADWTPAEIFALEPSPGMRAVLLSRLASRDLLSRVTVLPCDALGADLPAPADAVLLIHVLYALEPDYRRRLWPVLAAALKPGGLLAFTWRDGGPPPPRPLAEQGSRRVGRHTYTVLSEILESGGEACRARYLHRVTAGDTILSEEEMTGYVYQPAGDVLRRELASAGFAPAQGADGLPAWRRAP